ncbi:hypothetical protein EWM64_g7336 [Hericium alpestre]|uniref:Uncharacterized protein n=1 Tax=Hericium alpestre TaxID=135208 RepID=A0A4Y9ZQ15_9AGAM|nr:hypothetical protein EWM64_g7336 [Hericium alpestre]
MDNPQHYQPLSHALHPPLVRSPQYHTYDTSGHEYAANGSRREEEEEEEEENKRRPGRPKGSRNRKPRESAGSASKAQHGFHNYPPPPSGAPNLPGVTPQNQQYYEFQWRILNLCSEFYGAAEELVKATPSTVIAQSYQMGPSNKLDPLNMLNDAKRICDQLLQNPSQLVGQTPPVVYPSMSYAQPPSATPAPSPASTSTQPAQVITNPQSFIMPLGSHPGAPMSAMPYPMYATPSRYAPGYYPYPGYYSPAPAQSAQPSSAPPGYATPTANTSTIVNTTGAVSASGTWTDEEVERLKKLAEQGRSSGGSSDIDWDAVVGQWGNTRTRLVETLSSIPHGHGTDVNDSSGTRFS